MSKVFVRIIAALLLLALPLSLCACGGKTREQRQAAQAEARKEQTVCARSSWSMSIP